jgi:hypothetical protein
VGQAEPAADDPAILEQPLDVVWRRAGHDVEVLRLPAEQEISHAAPDEVGGVIEAAEPLDDLGGVGIYLIRRNLHWG